MNREKTRKLLIHCFLILSCFLFGSVSIVADTISSQEAEAVIQHTIILWLKQPQNRVHQATLEKNLKALGDIPGVLSMRIGKVFPVERNPANINLLDASFDLSVTLFIKNEQAYAEYIKHPIHSEMARDTIAPLLKRYLMYDSILIQ